MNQRLSIALVVLTAVAGAPGRPVYAATNAQVDSANALYRNGDYQAALDSYTRMAEENPESPELFFNRGAAAFQLGDVTLARESFEQAGLLTDDPSLQALSAYNMGNCSFQEAQQKAGEDLDEALASLNQSIRYYKDALARNQDLSEAAHNLEATRRAIRQLQEQKKQQEQEEQHQQNEMKEKLDEIIEEQTQQNQQSAEAAQQQQDPAQPDPSKQQMDELAGDQQQTREKTEELTDQMKAGDDGTSPMNEARQHAEEAARKQQEAEEHLKNQDPAQANDAQETALDELKKARDALGDGDESEDQQANNEPGKGESQGESDEKPEPQPEDSAPQDQEPTMQGSPGEMSKVPPPDSDARDILNQEKRNKEQRRLQKMIRLVPVEKDW